LGTFQGRFGGYKAIKSAIQAPTAKPLPEKLINKNATFRKKENEGNAKNKKQ
jgi:hypothetical protein